MEEIVSSENSSIQAVKPNKNSGFSRKCATCPSINNSLLKKTRYFYKSLDVDSVEELKKVSFFMKRQFNESTGELEYY